MKLSKYILRFNDLYKAFISPGNGGGKILCLIDWWLAFICYGTSFYDYFAYGFYEKRGKQRREYMTWRKHTKVQKIFNDPTKISVMRDKEEFNAYFKDCLGRESRELGAMSEKDFEAFFSRHKEIFVKDAFGLCGKGIGVYKYGDHQAKQLYDELRSDTTTKYLIESCMHQHEDIAKLHPWSINTIRIVTVYNKKTDEVHIVCARQRIGNKKHRVDNFHYEGLCAVIDVDSGIITSVGYDKNGRQYVRHPLTGEVIPGFQEPNWAVCKSFVSKVARMVPEIGYVGWDIVAQQDGSFALIEGNDNADHDVQQVNGKGIWPVYEKIIKEIR